MEFKYTWKSSVLDTTLLVFQLDHVTSVILATKRQHCFSKTKFFLEINPQIYSIWINKKQYLFSMGINTREVCALQKIELHNLNGPPQP